VLRLSGTLSHLGLSPILRFFNNVSADCRLRISKGEWTAELFISEGQVVNAAFGLARGLGGAPFDPLRGVRALDAVAIFLAYGAFFATEQESFLEPDPGLPVRSLETHLDDVQRRFVRKELTSAFLLNTPVRRGLNDASCSEDELSLTRRRLGLLLAIDGHDTALELFRVRDVIGTLEDLTWLQQQGFVSW
jgi:hypothetical protein